MGDILILVCIVIFLEVFGKGILLHLLEGILKLFEWIFDR